MAKMLKLALPLICLAYALQAGLSPWMDSFLVVHGGIFINAMIVAEFARKSDRDYCRNPIDWYLLALPCAVIVSPIFVWP